MPIDPASLVSAGASIIGGLLGNQGSGAMDTWRNTDAGIHAQIRMTRKYAEKYGFNPLAWIGATSPIQGHPRGNEMGQAIADAGMFLADGLRNSAGTAQKLNQYQQENEQLKKQVQKLTLRPKVGGIYAANETAPSRSEALGYDTSARVAGGSVSRGGAAGGPVPALGDQQPDWVDTRREQDIIKTVNDPGVGIIDNPNINRAFPVPMVNGEVLELGQAMVVGGSLLYDKALQRAEYKARHSSGAPLALTDDYMPPISTRLYGKPRDNSRRYPPFVNNRVSYEIYSALRKRRKAGK